MPVLPVYVHHDLGFGTFVVGLVAGTQFAATLISRLWAGRYADVRGSKRAVLIGLLFAAAAGTTYLVSTYFVSHRTVSVTILLVGRALLGVMETSHSRGVAMGTYTAFLDVALGLASPLLRLLAGAAGLSVVFLVSAGVALCTAVVGVLMLTSRSTSQLGFGGTRPGTSAARDRRAVRGEVTSCRM